MGQTLMGDGREPEDKFPLSLPPYRQIVTSLFRPLCGPVHKTYLRRAISCTCHKTVLRSSALYFLMSALPLTTYLTLTTLGSHFPLVCLRLCFLGTRAKAVGTRHTMGLRSWMAYSSEDSRGPTAGGEWSSDNLW